jgi:ElaB/YqjD/DUF883 family membrane-anchored ribosome-binding protein
MTDAQRLAQAEQHVERTRERLLDTLYDLAEQLEPKRLVRELWQDAKVKGADLAEEAVDAVKARPIAATGVAAAIAMFLAREPIAELAGKLINSKKNKAEKSKSKQKDDASAKTAKAPARKKAVESKND